ncbi:MAG: DUF4089 domain-containing protein [Cyanobacteriota bacterium]|nr:DUF4089 domain-containing protein [Cyanobacteriota bacterium]
MTEKPLELESYVEQMSALLDLRLSPESKVNVIENLRTLARISKLFTEYPVPENTDIASKFKP